MAQPKTTMKVEINTENSVFEDSMATELGRILRDLATRVEAGELLPIKLMDVNGNSVGIAKMVV